MQIFKPLSQLDWVECLIYIGFMALIADSNWLKGY